jgi:hypothetical protein
MEALKTLRPGRVAPFTRVAWPEPGTWLDADGPVSLCRSGVHALLPEVLPMWIAEELWRVEVADAENLAPGIVAGSRGRLLARVEAWNDETAREFARACANRVREGLSGRAAERAAMAVASAEEAVAGPSTTTVTYMAAHAAEAAAPGGYAAEREWQARWLAERLGL